MIRLRADTRPGPVASHFRYVALTLMIIKATATRLGRGFRTNIQSPFFFSDRTQIHYSARHRIHARSLPSSSATTNTDVTSKCGWQGTKPRLFHWQPHLADWPEDMGPPSGSSSHFQTLLEAALRDYEKQTGTKLAEHPLAHQLETCHSVESVTALLQRQAPGSNKFRGDDSRAMKSLNRGVHVLYMLSATTLLGEGVGMVRRTEAPLPQFLVSWRSYFFACRLSHPRGRYLLVLAYYLSCVPPPINQCCRR